MSDYMRDHNPKMGIIGSHHERVSSILERAQGMDGRVGDVLGLLEDSKPKGDHQDSMGSSKRQFSYICHLAEFSLEEERQFVSAIKEGGGLSMAQCHYLITKLKEKRRQEKHREKKEIEELERLYGGA
jgi:hypothetical protein